METNKQLFELCQTTYQRIYSQLDWNSRHLHHYDFEIKKNELDTKDIDSLDKYIFTIEGKLDKILEIEERKNIIVSLSQQLIEILSQLKPIVENELEKHIKDQTFYALKRHELINTLEDCVVQQKEITLKTLSPTSSDRYNQIKEEYHKKKSSWDELRKETLEQIELRKERILTDCRQMNQLEKWTSQKIGNILFDSNKDNWNSRNTIMERIKNKENLIFLIESENGEQFGGYIHSKIPEKEDIWITDTKSFLFNIQSNKRLNGMMKFEIKQHQRAFYIHDSHQKELLFIGSRGSLCVYTQNMKSESYCEQYESCYNYHGIENALCGSDEFTPKRITVIQMKDFLK